MKEIWKTIEGYTDYQISNYGRVKSLWFKKEKILKLSDDTKKYLRCSILKKKVHYTTRIHRLVAQAFIPNPENKPQVNHIDGNTYNNFSYNLEWVTPSENQIHAFRIGLQNSNHMIGEKHFNSKLTEIEVLVIHGLYLSGLSQYFIGKMFNVSQSNIFKIISGKKWKKLIGV